MVNPFEELAQAIILQAVKDGMADAWKEFGEFKARDIDTGKKGSADVFGTREYLRNNYLYRMSAAVLGIYGNSKEEALYPIYFVDSAGEPLDASGLVRIDLPVAEISEEEIVCHVLISDHYGNLTLNLDGTVLEESFLGRVDGVRVRTAAGPARMRVCRTFAEAAEDEAVLYTDSSGSLAMAVNHGSAAERLGLVPDDEIKLAPMP